MNFSLNQYNEDITNGLVCPNVTAIDKPLICLLSLKVNNQTFTAFMNYGDGSPEQQIQFNVSALNITKYFSMVGYFNITAYVPQVDRTFRQRVYMRRKFKSIESIKN